MVPEDGEKPNDAVCRRLADFSGRWTLSRRIEDRLQDAVLTLDGRAELTATGDALAYRETGLLRLADGRAVQAEREYVWREVAGRIAVHFPDGRFFHDFDPAAPGPQAHHWCDPDAYAVSYDLSGWPVWSAEWQVRGPRKDYRMETLYRRLADP